MPTDPPVNPPVVVPPSPSRNGALAIVAALILVAASFAGFAAGRLAAPVVSVTVGCDQAKPAPAPAPSPTPAPEPTPPAPVPPAPTPDPAPAFAPVTGPIHAIVLYDLDTLTPAQQKVRSAPDIRPDLDALGVSWAAYAVGPMTPSAFSWGAVAAGGEPLPAMVVVAPDGHVIDRAPAPATETEALTRLRAIRAGGPRPWRQTGKDGP